MAFAVHLTSSALRFIRAARIAHLATADAHRQPLAVPICFVFDGKKFFSPLDEKPKRTAPRKLKRARNIVENPQVSLVIDRYDENWRRLAYILVIGKARMLFRGARHAGAVKRLRAKYPQYRRMAINERPMILITPLRWIIWGDL